MKLATSYDFAASILSRAIHTESQHYTSIHNHLCKETNEVYTEALALLRRLKAVMEGKHLYMLACFNDFGELDTPDFFLTSEEARTVMEKEFLDTVGYSNFDELNAESLNNWSFGSKSAHCISKNGDKYNWVIRSLSFVDLFDVDQMK